MNSLWNFVFDLHFDDSNPNFQSVKKKRVKYETYKRFWNNFPPKFTKTFIFEKLKFIFPFSLHLFY